MPSSLHSEHACNENLVHMRIIEVTRCQGMSTRSQTLKNLTFENPDDALQETRKLQQKMDRLASGNSHQTLYSRISFDRPLSWPANVHHIQSVVSRWPHAEKESTKKSKLRVHRSRRRAHREPQANIIHNHINVCAHKQDVAEETVTTKTTHNIHIPMSCCAPHLATKTSPISSTPTTQFTPAAAYTPPQATPVSRIFINPSCEENSSKKVTPYEPIVSKLPFSSSNQSSFYASPPETKVVTNGTPLSNSRPSVEVTRASIPRSVVKTVHTPPDFSIPSATSPLYAKTSSPGNVLPSYLRSPSPVVMGIATPLAADVLKQSTPSTSVPSRYTINPSYNSPTPSVGSRASRPDEPGRSTISRPDGPGRSTISHVQQAAPAYCSSVPLNSYPKIIHIQPPVIDHARSTSLPMTNSSVTKVSSSKLEQPVPSPVRCTFGPESQAWKQPSVSCQFTRPQERSSNSNTSPVSRKENEASRSAPIELIEPTMIKLDHTHLRERVERPITDCLGQITITTETVSQYSRRNTRGDC